MAEISGLFSIDCDGITFSSTDGASGFGKHLHLLNLLIQELVSDGLRFFHWVALEPLQLYKIVS